MLLSDKGKKKILDNFYWFATEFEQEDFEGMVVLTVEEAKQANNCVAVEIANLINDFGPADLIHKLETLHQSLKEKIEQVESNK